MENMYGIHAGGHFLEHFPWKKKALGTPVGRSGLPESPGSISPEENSLEHARWTFETFRESGGHFLQGGKP